MSVRERLIPNGHYTINQHHIYVNNLSKIYSTHTSKKKECIDFTGLLIAFGKSGREHDPVKID